MNKRGQMMMGMMGPRKIGSLVLGFLMLALGVIPLLHNMNVIGFTIPGLPEMVLWVLALVAGILLFWDGFSEAMGAFGMMQMVMFASYALAIASLALGIVPILYNMQVISFSFGTVGTAIIHMLFTIDGLLLIIGGTQGF
jgi:hypothetical protein